MNRLFESFNHPLVFQNSHKSFLLEKALQNREGQLGPHGEFIIKTGKHTGRSANDKYVVMNEMTADKIWWDNNIHQMNEQNFNLLKKEVMGYLEDKAELYYTNRLIGSEKIFSLGIELITPYASSALFSQYMFKADEGKLEKDNYRIIHAPDFKLDPRKYQTRSETVVVTCFKEKMTIIVGTLYAGEIKKSMFSIMNYILPDQGILPMHAGANQNLKGESFIFFGLSGTGKTTLSSDEHLALIGDDEHGLSKDGVFNFEGGCYAKTSKLKAETEPAIYAASTQFSSFLENVKLKEDRSEIDFFDESLTENGRSSYPLSFIKDRVESGLGKIPQHIFYLSADAFGVLPPVSLLSLEMAMDYFVLGYSAKLAGTEIGVKSPVATFSSCFGAPFMLRHAEVYAGLLREYITKYNIKVWLVNTGWYGGGYGVGERFPLKVTRSIIRAIQNGKLDEARFVEDDIFHFRIPLEIEGVDPSILVPKNAWKDAEAYKKAALNLSQKFTEQLKGIKKK